MCCSGAHQPYQVELSGNPNNNTSTTLHGEAVPFSSSFFPGRLLNDFHHEVRSRLAEAGSAV
jgi:hypothetical protein